MLDQLLPEEALQELAGLADLSNVDGFDIVDFNVRSVQLSHSFRERLANQQPQSSQQDSATVPTAFSGINQAVQCPSCGRCQLQALWLLAQC